MTGLIVAKARPKCIHSGSECDAVLGFRVPSTEICQLGELLVKLRDGPLEFRRSLFFLRNHCRRRIPDEIFVAQFAAGSAEVGSRDDFALARYESVPYTLPDLSITKGVTPPTAYPGDTITYTLAFSNAGAGTATGVVITDTVPVSVTGTGVISSGVVITQRLSTRYVWDAVDLAPGAGGVITVTGELTSCFAAGTLSNAVQISGSGEVTFTNNSDSAALTVLNAAPGVVELNVIGAPVKGPVKVEAGAGMVKASSGSQSVTAPCVIKTN